MHSMFHRLPIALLIAALVSVGLGSAFAAGSDSPAPSMRIAEPRLGDAGTYTINLTGDWDNPGLEEAGRSQAPYGEPWTALRFQWRDGAGRDAGGAPGPLDVLAMDHTVWDFNLFGDEENEWQLKTIPSEDRHLPGSWALASTRRVIDHSSDGFRNTEVLGTDVLGNERRTSIYAWTDYDEPLPECLFASGWHGRNLAVGDELRWGRDCRAALQPQGGYGPFDTHLLAGDRFRVAGVDELDSGPAFRVERVSPHTEPRVDHDALTLWFAPGIPVPVRFVVDPVDSAGAGLPRPGALATFEMTAFTRGDTERVVRPRGASLESPALGAWSEWGPQEDGVEHPFPASKAYELVLADPSLRRYLDAHPDAYVYRANGGSPMEMYGYLQRSWTFTFTDGDAHLHAWASESISVALDSLSEPARSHVADRQTGTEELDGWDRFDLEFNPAPEGPPATGPTVHAAMARWQAFGGEDGNGWGFRLRCGATCQEPHVIAFAGEAVVRHLTFGPAGDPTDAGTLRADADVLYIRQDGTAVGHYEGRLDFGGTTLPALSGVEDGDAAGSEDVAAAAWWPGTAAAAGAGLTGLLAGLLYLVWPWLKGGVGLFSRIGTPQALRHPVRRRIVELAEVQPGIHFREITRRLELANGTSVHHLACLERTGHIVARRDGAHTRYHTPGRPPAPQAALSDGARSVLAAVRTQPGCTIKEAAQAVRLRPSTVHYHTQRLQEQGLLSAERDGRTVRLSAARRAPGTA